VGRLLYPILKLLAEEKSAPKINAKERRVDKH